MAETPKRDDRRTRYTKMVIHDAFLELLEEKGFDGVSVTDICKLADVNRGTFYLHYEDKPALLDEIVDEALDTEPPLDPEDGWPLRRHAPGASRYRMLYTDPRLLARLAQRALERDEEQGVARLMERTGLGAADAGALFTFLFAGSIALDHSLGWKRNLKTEHAHELVRLFAEAGCAALKDPRPSR